MVAVRETSPKVTFSQEFFNMPEALRDLHAGKDPREVFPRLKTEIALADLAREYRNSPNTDGLKDAVETLRLALCLDVASHIQAMPVDKVSQPIPVSSPVFQFHTQQGFVEEGTQRAYQDGKSAINALTSPHVPSHVFGETLSRMSPVLKREVIIAPDMAKANMRAMLIVNGMSAILHSLPKYFQALIEAYEVYGAGKTVPAYGKFLELTRTSRRLLHPTALDIVYLQAYEIVAFGSTFTPHFSALVAMGNLELRRLKDGREEVALSKEGKEAVSRNYYYHFSVNNGHEPGVNSHRITGCPGGKQVKLGDTTYDGLVDTIFERTLAYFPPISQ